MNGDDTEHENTFDCKDGICRVNECSDHDEDTHDDDDDDDDDDDNEVERALAAIAITAEEGPRGSPLVNDSLCVRTAERKSKRRGPKQKTAPERMTTTTTTSSVSVRQVHTQQDLDRLLDATRDDDEQQQPRPLLVEFVTTWCSACHSIQPFLDTLAVEHAAHIRCARVVCDKNKETKRLAAAYGIQSYPVFVVLEGGKMTTDRWEGADVGKLEKMFEKYSTTIEGGRRHRRKKATKRGGKG